MARDFANRGGAGRAGNRSGGKRRKKPATPKSRRKKTGFHGPSFSAGIVLGAAIVITGAYAPELLREHRTPGEQARPTPKPAVEFRFDEKLRNQEIEADPGPYVSTINPSADRAVEYLIQAASFQSQDDADTLRAQLLLAGLPAKTNPVRVGDTPWYRVTVGPFPSNVESGRAMTRLRELDLDAFLIKREVGP